MAAMMKSTIDACPNLETLAAYLDGRLSDRDRAAIAAHIADCPDCYFVFTEAAQLRARETSPETLIAAAPSVERQPGSGAPNRRTPRISRPVLAGLAAAAALIVATTIGITRTQSESAGLRALVAAVGTDRTVEPRLTGGFAYGPLRGALRGREPQAPAITPEVTIAAANIERLELGRRDARALRTLAIAYLVTNDIDRSVAALEAAAEQWPTDGLILSDLAAAYLVRASRTSSPQDLAKALAAADNAVKAAPNRSEALFNRALALDRLGLTDEARTAWADYIRIDARSGWADEARARLRKQP